MLKVRIYRDNKHHNLFTIYHLWDNIPEDMIVRDIHKATEADIGKYLLLNDGSDWLVKIRLIGKEDVLTDIGGMYPKDIVNQSIPKPFRGGYSGLFNSYRHLSFFPVSKFETEAAYKMIVEKDFKGSKYFSPSVYMLVLSKMQEIGRDMGVDEGYLVNRLIREADNLKGRGSDRLEALKILSRMMGVELDRKETKEISGKAVFNQLNVGTIQDLRKLTNGTQKKTDSIIDMVNASYQVENNAEAV